MLRGVAIVLVAMLVSAGNVAAQKPLAPADPPPPAAAASGLPQPGESNAERAKTQPGNNAPFWRAVRESGAQAGYVSLPGPELGQLVQQSVKYPGSQYTTAGEAWRQVRNVWLIPYGGALMLIALLAVGLLYLAKGPIKVKAPATGRMIERFTPMERAAHWVGAITFVVLAVSGIVMAFGKFFLLPVLGLTLFGWLTYALKTLHNVVGPLFAVSMLILIVTFVKDNLPRRHDLAWLSKAGGFLGGAHVPSHRFNAGEKFMFWGGVLVLGLVTAGSGLVLDQLIPQVAPTRGNMQVAHMIHGAASILMMALFTGHIYMGSVGVKGAYGAMRHGYVDEAWAKEHHELWHDDIKAGRIPAQRSASGTPPADTAGARA
ncbi:MAG: formate dehydrogenase subunit gamma [Rubrivivax sp.]|nr:formate dehydrogenase subunit gamma [Rubrivivax sp.]